MANSLVSERGVSPVNLGSKRIQERTNCQNGRPGMNKGQSTKEREPPDWSQGAMTGRDSAFDNPHQNPLQQQLSHTTPGRLN